MGGQPGQPSGQFASAIGQDRLVRKETSLGIIRAKEPPQDHIGLQLVPWLEVATDDVVFSYLGGLTDGLAPARAETAEAELAQKDENAMGQGRASVIDWSLKDHYTASDVNRARDLARMVEQLNSGQLPLFAQSATEDWAGKISRDRNLRRRKLDNRIEKLILDALANGTIVYDDGKIKFAVDYGRPANQQAGNAANDVPAKYKTDITDGVWDISGTTFDPYRTFLGVSEYMYDTYGVHMDRVIGSKRAFNTFINSDKFIQRAGLGFAMNSANAQVAPDPLYLMDGWGPEAARALVQRNTDITFIEADAVYRTRPIGSSIITNTRFWPETRLVFLPRDADMSDIDGTALGFGKTLTAPHPEGNWQSGFYEWERSTIDPWGQDMGNGVKAFPVFPYMEYSFAVDVVLPS
jgi:hypothetical protein